MLNYLEQRRVLQTPGVSAGKRRVTFDHQQQKLSKAGELEGTVIASLSAYQDPPSCPSALPRALVHSAPCILMDISAQ